ncbi:unnamed protein product, partial [Cladocopium goreaui]
GAPASCEGHLKRYILGGDMAARVLLEKWLSGPPPKPTGIASVASEDCRQSHCEVGQKVLQNEPHRHFQWTKACDLFNQWLHGRFIPWQLENCCHQRQPSGASPASPVSQDSQMDSLQLQVSMEDQIASSLGPTQDATRVAAASPVSQDSYDVFNLDASQDRYPTLALLLDLVNNAIA